MENLPQNIIFEGSESRLDSFLQQTFPQFSRTYWQKKIKVGEILVAGKQMKAGCRLIGGEIITLQLSPPVSSSLSSEFLPLTIVYEDSHLIVVDKPAGLVTHPAVGHPEHTLVNAILYHCQDLKSIGGVNRPGIVHRLDKDTSGLIVIAKDEDTYQGLKSQWEKRTIKREYLALCQGHWGEKELILEAPIGRHSQQRKKMAVTAKNSRPAVTLFTLKEDLGEFAYIKAELKTGRTHQIRVHLAYLKRPLIGDQLYGSEKSKKLFKRQALHAYHLAFIHPISNQFLDFYLELPNDMLNLLKQLQSQNK